jgi:parallel beta-helix repeat protein
VSGPNPEDRPILDGTIGGGAKLKDGMVVSGAKFTISGFLVRSYAGNGITTQKTHDVTFRDIITDGAGKYGLYPVESENILIENCVATNIADAGIYVGQSRHAVVRGCVAHANVAGIEIENTVDATVDGNEAYDNAGGILVFLLPGGASKMASDCTVSNNYVHDNNHVNFGDPTSTVSKVPPGFGMLVMAADNTKVTGNRIIGNGSSGITITSLAALFPNPAMLDVEPNSDGTQLLNNTYQNNGNSPSKAYLDLVGPLGITKGADILFEGTGKNNCQDEAQIDNLVTQGIPLNRC